MQQTGGARGPAGAGHRRPRITPAQVLYLFVAISEWSGVGVGVGVGSLGVGGVGSVGGEWWALGLGALGVAPLGVGVGVPPLWPAEPSAFRALLHRYRRHASSASGDD